MFKIAYCGFPHTGGTYTIYRLLREELVQHDIELRWVALVPPGFQLGDEFQPDKTFGELVNFKPGNPKETASIFVKHIETNYDGIIINVLANTIQINAARYIKNYICKLQLVHSITPATYRAARVIRDHVHATVCPSPRISRDLIYKMNFPPKKIHNISHAVNLPSFNQVCSKRSKDSPLKLLYLGRLEDGSKGILWLPDILKNCLQIGVNVLMTVAGDGPDLSRLEVKINQMGLGKYINFYGKVNYVEVPKLLTCHHVFLMPSRYEGFGFSLIEAMASGCVPVCSRISGVTDFIVSHGENGFLFDVGNVKLATRFISQLTDEKIWQHFSINARLVSQSRFSIEQQAQSYASLIKDLMENLPEIAQPLSLDNWQLPSGLKPSFSVYIPARVKNILRLWWERLASRAK
jgi:glycosyltransferase involved in cell wall biosynthesis